ncbi:CCR4-NOT transcription complex subunit 4-like protein [Drosera capensis]
MASESVINIGAMSNSSKDLGKKKRANRTAKLKQCKLDARREQWLSHVKSKGEKEEARKSSGELQVPEIRDKISPKFKELDVGRPSEEEDIDGFIQHESGSESPAHSPSSGTGSGNSFTGSSSSSCNSSFSRRRGFSGGSFSEEEEEGGGEDGCLDDWEAVADALTAASDDKQSQNGGKISAEKKKMAPQVEGFCKMSKENVVIREEKKSDAVGVPAASVVNNRAWRPDDAFRPQSLPNLSKQRSFPVNSEKIYTRRIVPWSCNRVVSVPKSCPICCEDLDITDTSFLPCPCGFGLCLFCHKRIVEEDGRCPGCRKPYASNPTEKEASVAGGSLAVRLARSCSMFSRS